MAQTISLLKALKLLNTTGKPNKMPSRLNNHVPFSKGCFLERKKDETDFVAVKNNVYKTVLLFSTDKVLSLRLLIIQCKCMN